MPWLRSCLSRKEKKKPKISPPLHLLLKAEGDIQAHCFRVKKLKKPRPCHVCHQPILNRGSMCKVCKYVCHHACEAKIIKDDSGSRYADTSLAIHQQWGQRKVHAFPSVATVLEDSQQRVTASNCQTLPPPARQEPLKNGDQFLIISFKASRTKAGDLSNRMLHSKCGISMDLAPRSWNKSEEIRLDFENGHKVAVPFKTVILYRIAFAIWQAAFHLQAVSKNSNDAKSVKIPPSKQKPTPLITPPRPAPKISRQLRETMDFSFVTERIIALYFPENVSPQAFRQGHRQAAHLLTTKHASNYMVFNLTEPRRSARSQHARVRELNWTPGLAPPLDKLCSICKEIETWLNGDSHRIAVLHSRGDRERIGVVVASFMHYSNICGTADQALDRFAMEKFLDDKIQELEQPSQRRYVDYFAGLLSGNIKVNSAPLYLTHITVLGAPAFEANTEGVVCRAFIKIYEGLVPVYTSGVHRVTPGTRQFTVSVAGDRRNQGLQLRGDVLVKCYHKHPKQREVIFACQFHTCTISDYTLTFTRHELDSAAYDLRFPLDGAVEFHFSSTPMPRLPLPAPTPAIAVESNDDPIVRWDSYSELALGATDPDSDLDNSGDPGREVSHTFGPLDGSIYATVAKKVSPVTAGTTTIGSPRTVSMDSGISSAGNGLQNNNSNASSSSPAPTSNLDTQRAWDELLREMQITVESIPDTSPRMSALPRSATYAGPSTVRTHTRQTMTSHSALPTPSVASGASAFDDLESVAYIDDPEEIPYHARQDSRPFTYGSAPGPEMLRGQPGLSSPSLVRKASFGKNNNYNSENKYDKYGQNSWTLKTSKSENPWAAQSEHSWTSTTPRNVRIEHAWTSTTTPRNARSWDTTDSTSTAYRWKQTSAPVSRKSFDFIESSISNGTTNGSVTWLQRQQQKLRERREAALRMERRPQEVRLMSELKSHYHHRPSASHRDGYTSDTTHFADDDDDDDDLSVPLHVQTSPTRHIGSAPASPLPRRVFQNGVVERPFVQVKKTLEQNRKYPIDSSTESPTEPGLLTLAKDDVDSRYSQNALTALIASLGPQRVPDSRNRPIGSNSHDVTNHSVMWQSQLRDDSLSSWRTASISDDPGSPSRTNSPRPVTPAFPVYPRTPYSNGSVTQIDINGLPPKSPTAQRKERSPSPSTDSHLQYSPRSTASSVVNGGYHTHSQRSSIHSNSEPPQEVSPAHVKFVRDTSRYWYKPTISREEAINMLRNEPPGTFVVRDSNSFAGAFGLAVKVATPPPGKSGSGPDELVRHFLIEPTSRGVRLKGCANEPVFSSLSALVYQHSITNMALPVRLLLPESEKRVEQLNTSTAQQLLAQGAACNVLYLITVDTESLTGPQAIRKAINQLFMTKPLPVAVIVHFKVSGQGITLTDNKRQVFFRRHYPVAAISHCGLDPDDHRWSHTADASGVPISSHRCFGFVARKPASKTDNQCHVFAELEPEQPATAIVNFVTKVMMTNSYKSNIV